MNGSQGGSSMGGGYGQSPYGRSNPFQQYGGQYGGQGMGGGYGGGMGGGMGYGGGNGPQGYGMSSGGMGGNGYGYANAQGGYGSPYSGGVQSQQQWNQQRPWDPQGQGIPQMGSPTDQWLPNYGSATPQYYNNTLWQQIQAAQQAQQQPAAIDPANTRPIADASGAGAWGPFGVPTPAPVAPTGPGSGTGGGGRMINDPTWAYRA